MPVRMSRSERCAGPWWPLLAAIALVAPVALSLTFPRRAVAQESLEPIELAVGEWRPFVSSWARGYGPIPVLVTEVLGRIGYRPRYVFMPWGQVERMVGRNEGRSGPRGMLPFRRTPEREGAFYVSERPLFCSCMRVFYNRRKVPGDPVLRSGDDLRPLNPAYVEAAGGYRYPRGLEIVLHESGRPQPGLYEAFERLVDSDDPVAAVPAETEVGRSLLTELFPEGRFDVELLREEPGASGRSNRCEAPTARSNADSACLFPVRYHFMLSRRNPHNSELMARFDDAYASLDQETLARTMVGAWERPTATHPAVRIESDEAVTIPAVDDVGREYVLPRGTRGLLLEWEADGRGARARVRVISGPHRGRNVRIDGRYVRLE
ncbi:MAG: hypothetical protein ACODAA_04035 [Gemmatimonadota bacterium]